MIATNQDECSATSESAGDGTRSRVMLVDDHPLVRKGLVELVNEECDLVICGEAEDAAQALDMLDRTRPHLVLMDISLRTCNGVDLTREMLKRVPSQAVLILSMHDDPATALRSLAAGARGYVVKYEEPGAILAAIRCTLEGGRYLSRQVARI